MSEPLVHTGQAIGWYRCDGKDCPICGAPSGPAETSVPRLGQSVWVKGEIVYGDQPSDFPKRARIHIHGIGTGIPREFLATLEPGSKKEGDTVGTGPNFNPPLAKAGEFDALAREAAQTILAMLGCVQGPEAKGEPFPDDVEKVAKIITLAAGRAASGAQPSNTWELCKSYREQAKAELKSMGFTPSEELQPRWDTDPNIKNLQWEWRKAGCRRDRSEIRLAIIDALTQEGIAAWHGDATSIVEQIVLAQYERAEKALAAPAPAQLSEVLTKHHSWKHFPEDGHLECVCGETICTTFRLRDSETIAAWVEHVNALLRSQAAGTKE